MPRGNLTEKWGIAASTTMKDILSEEEGSISSLVILHLLHCLVFVKTHPAIESCTLVAAQL